MSQQDRKDLKDLIEDFNPDKEKDATERLKRVVCIFLSDINRIADAIEAISKSKKG